MKRTFETVDKKGRKSVWEWEETSETLQRLQEWRGLVKQGTSSDLCGKVGGVIYPPQD